MGEIVETSLKLMDDLTVILENFKIRIFPKFWEK